MAGDAQSGAGGRGHYEWMMSNWWKAMGREFDLSGWNESPAG